MNNNFNYLQSELARLDVLIHREILRLRATYQLSLDEFRGLYISDQQVDTLINQISQERGTNLGIEELTQKAESLRKMNGENLRNDTPFLHIAKEFGLSEFEQDALLLALAPEIDLKYETLFAYLNNDITRKWPTYDMALRLFSADRAARMNLRGYLLPDARLFRDGLLQPVQSAQAHPSWLAGGFSLSPLAVQYLQGHSPLPPSLAACAERRIPNSRWEDLPLSQVLCAALRRSIALCRHEQSGKTSPVLIFEGHYGSGRSMAAEAICREMGLPIVIINMESLRVSAESVTKIMQGLPLQQRFQPSGIYIDHGEALFDKEGNPLPESYNVMKHLAQVKGPVIFACTPGTRWHELVKGQRHMPFSFSDLEYPDRLKVWQRHVSDVKYDVPQETLEALADRFILTPGQVRDAVTAAVDACLLTNGSKGECSSDVLFESARAQSDQSLGALAMKVNTVHTWDDLVLPDGVLLRVREIASAIKYRHVVYSAWGFGQRISYGKGLKTLFNGVSGTGKTMTAGVIARDLGLDLYKIDLSGVVSKYIGETEKNLDRIFRASRCSNAILFFDEADALFGKRSEVKDAHDRYANIEVSYLLQKIEEHEGVVILASNLGKNIDESFSRRMHYIVDFPLPGDKHREQLWRGMFPAQAPVNKDVNFPFLARQFDIAGGDIKNVALNAAFMAAQNGREITMSLIIKSVARQMVKQGKIPTPSDFKEYFLLINDGKT